MQEISSRLLAAPTQTSQVQMTLTTVLPSQAIFLRVVVVKAWSSNQFNTTSHGHCTSRCSVERNAYLLNHLINLLLPHEQNCGRKNALEEFISDTFVDSSNALVLYDRENTIECRLIPGVTGLEPALYNTENYDESSYTQARSTWPTYTDRSTQLQLRGFREIPLTHTGNVAHRILRAHRARRNLSQSKQQPRQQLLQ